MWDWTTSILKAQVRGRRKLRATVLSLCTCHAHSCQPPHLLSSMMTSSQWSYDAIPPLTSPARSLAPCPCCPFVGMTAEPPSSLPTRPW